MSEVDTLLLSDQSIDVDFYPEQDVVIRTGVIDCPMCATPQAVNITRITDHCWINSRHICTVCGSLILESELNAVTTAFDGVPIMPATTGGVLVPIIGTVDSETGDINFYSDLKIERGEQYDRDHAWMF